MTHGFDSSLLRPLKAAQEQKSTFAAELKRIADRCYAQHVTSTASETTKAAIWDDDVDTEMPDADVHSTEVEDMGVSKTDKAKASDFYCHPCYNDILSLVYHTYASPAQPQWYDAQKTTFLAELERRLESVRALRAPLDTVDEWITAQFHAWLRSQLQDAVALQTLLENWDTEKDIFQARLADSALTVPELLRDIVSKAVSFVNGDQVRVVADAETAAKTLQDTSSPSKKSAVLLGSLYPDGVPDLPAVRAIEKKLLQGTMGLDEGLRELIRDIYDGEDEGALAAKTEKHRKRLAEMRRAKAAHEAQKLKKMKPVDVPYFLQDDTSCAACRKASDPQKSPFCMVCFLEVDYCLRQNQTVWCTTTCMKENYARHLAAEHACAAGDRCCRSKPEADVARDEPRYYFCRECVLSFSIGTVYCNDRCAARDFRRHREKVHLPNREIRAEQRDDTADLVYSTVTKTGYKATDISKHLLSIREAMSSCQKKHPDWSLAEIKVKITLPWSA